jgi:23S rRNA pseudouridine1911/1915/1917 synthase
VILPASITADAAHDRMRLDVFISMRLAPEFSRSQVARMIKAGLVTVNGAAARASSGVRTGDRVEVARPPLSAELHELHPQENDAPQIEVIFADEEIIVVNKPAGMTVHPAPGHPDGTLVDALLARFPELAAMAEPDGLLRPGIVHRLDKDTSGVMVVARTPFARTSLSRQFKDRTVRKIYLAIVKGIVARDRITIEQPVGRHPIERKKMSVRSHMPRDAMSDVTVLRRFERSSRDGLEMGATLVRVKPATGRMHQIRVHLASIGHPCLGDRVYGGAKPGDAGHFDRQALHALALSITHPRSGEHLEFLAPLPADFVAFLADNSAGVDIHIDPAELRRWIEAD